MSRVRVVRLDTPLDAVSFDSLVRGDDAVSLEVAPLTADGVAAWEALVSAHVYHIASAKAPECISERRGRRGSQKSQKRQWRE